MAFSQQGPRTVCILSANGAICNVTLRQPAMSGGTVTYEVPFFSYKIHLIFTNYYSCTATWGHVYDTICFTNVERC